MPDTPHVTDDDWNELLHEIERLEAHQRTPGTIEIPRWKFRVYLVWAVLVVLIGVWNIIAAVIA